MDIINAYNNGAENMKEVTEQTLNSTPIVSETEIRRKINTSEKTLVEKGILDYVQKTSS